MVEPKAPSAKPASTAKKSTAKAAAKPAAKPAANKAAAKPASAAASRAQKVSSAAKSAAAKTAGAAAAAGAAGKTLYDSVDWKAQAEQLKEQAAHIARNAADSAKAQTGSAMSSLSKLIEDTAGTVDSKLGPQYGDYARSAATAVANAAKALDETDIDALIDEAQAFVKKSPAVAIGAAAVAGFVLMRLAKGSGSDD